MSNYTLIAPSIVCMLCKSFLRHHLSVKHKPPGRSRAPPPVHLSLVSVDPQSAGSVLDRNSTAVPADSGLSRSTCSDLRDSCLSICSLPWQGVLGSGLPCYSKNIMIYELSKLFMASVICILLSPMACKKLF